MSEATKRYGLKGLSCDAASIFDALLLIGDGFYDGDVTAFAAEDGRLHGPDMARANALISPLRISCNRCTSLLPIQHIIWLVNADHMFTKIGGLLHVHEIDYIYGHETGNGKSALQEILIEEDHPPSCL